MKWMIASDLHGSYYYAQQLQQAFEREQADRLLFLGDLLYHGPRNDLPRDYAPKQVIPLLNNLAPKLLCVRGNCDAEVDQMVLNFPVLANYAVLPVGQRLVYVTHGHVFNLNHLPQAFEREQADRLLFLGDLLYHGPRNDLPRDYAPKQVIPLLNNLAPKLLCVRGNCDAEVDQMVLNFPVLANYAVLPVGQRLVYVTHGHVFNLNHLPPLAPGDILLHGHTHVPAWTDFGQGNLYLNPGSVSLPKENTAHSYMTLEGSTACWKTMEGVCYHQLQL